MPHLRFAPSIASAATLATLLVACAGAGNAPTASQSGDTAQSAFVPQSGGVTASGDAFSTAIPQPLPEPRLALALGGAHPLLTAPIINDSGSYLNGAIVVGANTATAGYGVEGLAYGSGAGLYGHAGSTSITAYGVYGSSAGGAGVYGNDTKAGVGVLGVSTNGSGVHGETSYPSTMLESGLQTAGVLGEDRSTTGELDAGVAGISTNGTGVYAESKVTAVYGVASGNSGAGVVGDDRSAAGSEGTVGVSTNGVALVAIGSSSKMPALFTQNEGGGPDMVAKDESGTFDVMSLDPSGNMILYGNLTVDGKISSGTTPVINCGPGCATPLISSPGRGPQIESVGDARLSAGAARVTIDPAFAKQLDASRGYHVFLTPDGDCKGLYVAAKDETGFDVRELQSGRAGIAFDYRIVATPRQAALERPIQIRAVTVPRIARRT